MVLSTPHGMYVHINTLIYGSKEGHEKKLLQISIIEIS